MAKANSTRGTNTNNRPMLCHSADQAEAINSVRNVLSFMAATFREGVDLSGDQQMLDGAGLILETCSETLGFHLVADRLDALGEGAK